MEESGAAGNIRRAARPADRGGVAHGGGGGAGVPVSRWGGRGAPRRGLGAMGRGGVRGGGGEVCRGGLGAGTVVDRDGTVLCALCHERRTRRRVACAGCERKAAQVSMRDVGGDLLCPACVEALRPTIPASAR